MKNRNIFFDDMKKQKLGFTRIPNLIFKLYPPINHGSIAIYMFLLSKPESFNPSIGLMHKELNISRNTIRRHLTYLEARGIIKRIVKGHIAGKTKVKSLYEFRPIKEWK